MKVIQIETCINPATGGERALVITENLNIIPFHRNYMEKDWGGVETFAASFLEDMSEDGYFFLSREEYANQLELKVVWSAK